MAAIRHLFGLALAVLLTAVALYMSRFWIWTNLWGNDGLFGAKIVSRFGDLVQFWMRGTWLSEFNLIVWGCGTILVLSILHWIAARFAKLLKT